MGWIPRALVKKIFKKCHRNYFTAKKDIIQRPMKLLSVLDKKKLFSVLDKKITLCIKQSF